MVTEGLNVKHGMLLSVAEGFLYKGLLQSLKAPLCHLQPHSVDILWKHLRRTEKRLCLLFAEQGDQETQRVTKCSTTPLLLTT